MSENNKDSITSRIGRISTADSASDPYDHAISLVDATAPAESSTPTPNESDASGWRQLARNSTRTSVKDHLARRKYAKWSQDKFNSTASSVVIENDVDKQEEGEQPKQRQGKRVEHAEHTDSAAVDFGHPPSSPEVSKKDTPQKPKRHRRKEKLREESVIDILYENQRGSFFCGIPLYSHSSLLNFDPAPWVTQDYKPSPVNITNAQVPDPSWQWSWKHWYVDMSDDVDEDGWQYSFAFFGKFSWHGTHPWFHSFCRRRRWLRKRIKPLQHELSKIQPSSMSAAHRLNTDYFTIHSKRDRSPSFIDNGPKTARPDSFISYATGTTVDDEPDEINSIPSLMRALRIATVDREKIEAVKKFVELGGEELAYLKEQIREIMEFLIYQNSKRQILEFLRQQAREAQQHRAEHDAEDKPEGEAESRRIDNLLKAVEAADEEVRGLEYWSDRKHVMETTEHTKSLTESPLVTIFDKSARDPRPEASDNIAGDIRGIADKADIGADRVAEGTYRGAILAKAQEKEGTGDNIKGKGKGKEKDQSNDDDDDDDDSDTRKLSGRLKRDQVAIPLNRSDSKDASGDFGPLTL